MSAGAAAPAVLQEAASVVGREVPGREEPGRDPPRAVARLVRRVGTLTGELCRLTHFTIVDVTVEPNASNHSCGAQ